MGEAKFEMAVLLTVNRVWLKEKALKHGASSDDIAATAASILQFFGVNASDFENMREGEVAEATDVALSHGAETGGDQEDEVSVEVDL